jgi:hypothetical protein
VFQEERSIFWDVTISAILSKNAYMHMCPIPNGFRGTASSLSREHVVVKKKRVFIVQVTKLVQLTYYTSNIFSKIPPSTLMHFATRVKTWRVARLYSVQCTVQ